MKYVIIIGAFISLATVLHGMDKKSTSSSSSQEEELKENKATRKLVDLSKDAWDLQKGALDLSKQSLVSVDDFESYCTPYSPVTPPLFFYKTLTKLILSHNNLKEVDPSCFKPCENLRYFDASHNQLTDIDLGAFFKACPCLKYVSVAHNPLTTVVWSEHSVWKALNGDIENSRPMIDLSGYNISGNEQQWLQERYIQEDVRLDEYEECCIKGTLAGGAFCTTGGAISLLAAVLTKFSTPLVALGVPISWAAGTCVVSPVLLFRTLQQYENRLPLLYFSEEQSKSSAQDMKDIYANPRCCQCPYVFTGCKG